MGLVVRSPNWLGDAVMCLPAVDALSSEFGKITIVAKKSAIPVFQKYDCIECKGSMDTAALKLAKEKSGSDSIVLFTNSFTTALAARMAGFNELTGYAMYARKFLLTSPLAKPTEKIHQIEWYNRLAQHAGASNIENKPVLKLDSQSEITGSYTVIVPGVKYGSAKRWDNFGRLVDQLLELGKKVVILGFEEECSGFDFPVSESVINLVGKTDLKKAMEICGGAELVIGNDSGMSHVAAAQGVRTIVIFGAHDPKKTAPPGAEVVVGEAECAPCMLRICPIDHRCMRSLSVDDVIKKVGR